MTWVRESIPRGEKRKWWQGRVALLLAAALGVGALAVPAATMTVATPAAAADGTLGEVTNIKFKNDKFANRSVQELVVNWKFPDNPTAPATVTIPLPTELKGQPDLINVTHNGAHAGSCAVAASSVVCTLDPTFIAGGKINIAGELRFDVIVDVVDVPVEARTFDFGTVTSEPVTIVTPPGPGEPCVVDCEFPGTTAGKSGQYDKANETIEWVVALPSGPEGMEIGKTVRVFDDIDLTKFEIVKVEMLRATSVYLPPNGGKKWPNYRGEFAYAEKPTVSADKRSVEFVTAPGDGSGVPVGTTGDQWGIDGSVYLISWTVRPLDGGAAGTYSNSATWEIDGTTYGPSTATVVRQGGSGSVVGDDVAKFAVTKLVRGDGTVPVDQEYTLNWTVFDTTNPSDPGVKGTTKLVAGTPFFSAELPENRRVVITEVLPGNPAGAIWGTPKFLATNASGNPIAGAVPTDEAEVTFSQANGNLGKVTYFTLTNTLEDTPLPARPTSTFGIVKSIDGDGESLVPVDTAFTVDYEWEQGTGFEAGDGTLTVQANGTRVESDPIPVGAEVKLTEGTMPGVAGGTWGTPEFTPESFAVVKDEVASVTLTNTLTETPKDTDPVKPKPVKPEPVKPEPVKPEPGKPNAQPKGLANTGSDSGLALGVAGAVLLLGGLVVSIRARRNRSEIGQ